MSGSERRSLTAAIIAAAVLLAVSCGQWPTLLRPSYIGAVVLQCGVLALLLAAALPLRAGNAFGRMKGGASLALAGYALFLIAGSQWADWPVLSLAGAVTAVAGPLWAVLLGGVLCRPADARLVLRAVFFAGALAAATGLFWTLQTSGAEAIQMVMGHRNFLAIFVLPGLLLGGAELAARVTGRSAEVLALNRWAVGGGMVLMLAALGLCRSAGAFLSLCLGASCIAAFWMTRRQRWALAACAAALLIAAFLWTARAAHTGELMKSHHATRWYMWQGTLKMIAERPWGGWGTGMFALQFPPFKPTEPMRFNWLTSLTIYPHNELLLVTVEGGVAALALYLLAHVLAVRKRLTGTKEGAPVALADWALTGALAAMFMHGLVEVALRFWAPAAMYWTLLGLLIYRSGTEESPAPAPTQCRASPLAWVVFAAACALSAIALWCVVWPGLRSERLLNTSDSRAADATELAGEIAEALRLTRYTPDWLVGMGRLADAQAQAGDLDGMIRTYEEFHARAPGFGHVRRFLANAYLARAARRGPTAPEAGKADLARAVALLEDAVAANPYDPAARQSLAMALLTASLRNLPAALEHARASAQAAPESAEARYLHGALLLESGRKAEAARELEAAARLCPPGEERFREKIERARRDAVQDSAK